MGKRIEKSDSRRFCGSSVTDLGPRVSNCVRVHKVVKTHMTRIGIRDYRDLCRFHEWHDLHELPDLEIRELDFRTKIQQRFGGKSY